MGSAHGVQPVQVWKHLDIVLKDLHLPFSAHALHFLSFLLEVPYLFLHESAAHGLPQVASQ